MEGVSVSPTSEVQVNKTFELLLNDFKSFVNEKKVNQLSLPF
ncbi:hypothetical protein [Empedobacter brevis]